MAVAVLFGDQESTEQVNCVVSSMHQACPLYAQLLTYRCGAANRASWRYLRQWFGAHNANRPIGYRPALRRQIGRHSIRTSNLAIGLVKGF